RIVVDARDGAELRRESMGFGANACVTIYPDDPYDASVNSTCPIDDPPPNDYARCIGPNVEVHNDDGVNGDIISDMVDETGCWDLHWPADPSQYAAFDQVNAYWHGNWYMGTFLASLGFSWA